MTEKLSWEDYLTLGLYFCVVIAVGIWSTFGRSRQSIKGYFLAGKSMTFIPVGASIYSTNVGAPMFIGLVGTAAMSGIAVTIYEWCAVYILITLGWIFLPVYIASGAYTVPEYLRKRFGGKRIRIQSSVILLFIYIMRNISGEIYCGAIFMKQLLGWNLYLCVSVILVVVALYTVIGGLRAVIFTDTMQTVILIIGCSIVSIMSLTEVGGWNLLVSKYMKATANHTHTNQTVNKCGLPREDSFHIFRDPFTGDIPWTGCTLGLAILVLFVFCTDQMNIQRCISAKNMVHAKGGTLIAAGLKILNFPLFIIPGLISRILYTDEIACADPDTCKEVCDDPAGCSNIAFPLLVLRILPNGTRGLMLAALIAGLMSTLTSTFNSASSIVTLDIWGQLRKSASQAELMIVGRVTILVLAGGSIIWLPILQVLQGGSFWYYLVAITSYLVVPFVAAFVIGLFWKHATEPGIFWGMTIGLVIGLVRMGLDFAMPPPICGSGEPDTRLSIVGKVDLLHFVIINFIISSIVIIAISLCTRPRTFRQLHRVTWWTRHDKDEPELSEDEDESHELQANSIMEKDGIEAQQVNRGCSGKAFCRWLGGEVNHNRKPISAEERAVLHEKMTSIKESKRMKYTLNAIACFLITAVTGLLIYFG